MQWFGNKHTFGLWEFELIILSIRFSNNINLVDLPESIQIDRFVTPLPPERRNDQKRANPPLLEMPVLCYRKERVLV
jgi:hypothetical protein